MEVFIAIAPEFQCNAGPPNPGHKTLVGGHSITVLFGRRFN